MELSKSLEENVLMCSTDNTRPQAIRRYLADEHLDKQKCAWNPEGWDLVRTTNDTPRQLNGYDCGVFATFCAHYLSAGVNPSFSQADIPHLRRRMIIDILNKKINSEDES
jgi:sentrin-specific protease 1